MTMPTTCVRCRCAGRLLAVLWCFVASLSLLVPHRCYTVTGSNGAIAQALRTLPYAASGNHVIATTSPSPVVVIPSHTSSVVHYRYRSYHLQPSVSVNKHVLFTSHSGAVDVDDSPVLTKAAVRTRLGPSRATSNTAAGSAAFEVFISALQAYKQVFGDLKVPRNFTIPLVCSSHSQWPRELAGYRLGDKVSNCRSGRIHSSEHCIDVLNQMGFIWDNKLLSGQDMLDALAAFKAVYGHTVVPKSFVVPLEDRRYPERLRGMKLGLRLNNFKYRQDYKRHSEALFELGLDRNDNRFDSRHWDHIYEALCIFKALHGHTNVPLDWVVPTEGTVERTSQQPERATTSLESPTYYCWPRELWGLKLGFRVNNIRYRGDFVNDNPQYKDMLDNLGFVWKSRKSLQ